MGQFASTRTGPRLKAVRQTPEDVFISGVESITDIGGGMVRAVFYINRPAADGHLEPTILSAAIVCPVAAIPDAIGKAMMAIGRKVIARDDGSLTVAH